MKSIATFVVSSLLGLLLATSFPTVPTSDKLIQVQHIQCPPSYIGVALYHVQDVPHVDWIVFRDVNGKVLAMILKVDDNFVRAWATDRNGVVVMFDTAEALAAAVPLVCDLLSKGQPI